MPVRLPLCSAGIGQHDMHCAGVQCCIDAVYGAQVEQPPASSAHWGDIDTQLKWYMQCRCHCAFCLHLCVQAGQPKPPCVNAIISCRAGLSQGDAVDTQIYTFSETTEVQFGMLTDKEISAYIATGAFWH